MTPFPSPTPGLTVAPSSAPLVATSRAVKTTATAIIAPTPTPPGIKPTLPPTPTPGPKIVTRPPSLRATSAIAVDADTGLILYAKEPHLRRAIASTTKLMTALTLMKYFPKASDLQAETTIVEEDLVGEANMALRKGERIKISTLLLGLMTNSANEAGMAIARFAGQRLSGPPDPVERFVAAMNANALALGMYDSHFMNPHGLDEAGHYSSAYDLALSGWFALRNPTILQAAQYLYGTIEGHSFYNANSFLTRYPGATGLKPGLTDEAGRCWVASARANGRNVIVVVLNSPFPPQDVDPLMDYAFTLLDGKAEQSLSSLGLGWLTLPKEAQTPAMRFYNPQALQTALWQQIELGLRLSANQLARKLQN